MEHHGRFIGELADETGVAPSALRYYEAAGLLTPEARTESGYRVFDRRAAERLRFIQRAKNLGFKLSEIKRLIEAPASGERELFDRVVAAKLAETKSRIANLRATVKELERLETALAAQPPPAACHLGDCACWLPA
jgi:MerR family Zn(II)-responsive transcriptional regulator of zntA